MQVHFRLSLLIVLALLLAPPARAAEELCPNGTPGQGDLPGDVAGVQADIARLNLCVERAVLLKQLDDIAKQRQATLKKMTEPDDANARNFSGGVGGIPTMPLSALPSLPVDSKGLKSGTVQVKKPAGKPLEDAPAPVSTHTTWKLRKIWGGVGAMRAQLSDGTGTLLNVLKGDPLPDGSVIENVSIKGVTISQNGKISDLSWDETTDSGSPPKNAVKTAP